MRPALNLVFDPSASTSILVLVVMGLDGIAGTVGVFNFAHGGFLPLGACAVWRT